MGWEAFCIPSPLELRPDASTAGQGFPGQHEVAGDCSSASCPSLGTQAVSSHCYPSLLSTQVSHHSSSICPSPPASARFYAEPLPAAACVSLLALLSSSCGHSLRERKAVCICIWSSERSDPSRWPEDSLDGSMYVTSSCVGASAFLAVHGTCAP